MARDPRVRTLVSDAERSLSSLKRVEEEIEALRGAGLSSTTWQQQYRAHDDDLRVLREVQSAESTLSTAVAALEAAESRLADVLLVANPFLLPAEIEAEDRQLSQIAKAVRPGAASKLIELIDAGALSDSSREQLSKLAHSVSSVEKQGGGISRCAEAHADMRAYPGTKHWDEQKQKFYRDYYSDWRRLEVILLDLRASVKCRIGALEQDHVSKLLATETEPVHHERGCLIEALRSAVITAKRAEAYAKAAVEADSTADRQLKDAWASVKSLGINAARTRPRLSEQDRHLADQWSCDQGGGEYRRKAMLSARRAEVIACQLYRELYGEAEDLAILQAFGGADDRWKYADIRANGRWIDVKNARRNLSSSNVYSEHCVPRFKRDRALRDVVISGFLSPYDTREDEYDNGVKSTGSGVESVIWLGETTYDAITRLSQHFPFVDGLARDARETLLPGWLFDYPDICYRRRDAFLREIVSNDFMFPRGEVKMAFGVLAQRIATESTTTLVSGEALALQKRIVTSGLSRPVLFLHLLDRFCSARLAGTTFYSDALREILFPFDDKFWPLCVSDPLGMIADLLDVLERVDLQIKERQFSQFQFRARGVLCGITDCGAKQTLIAYCGGWKRLSSGSSVRCGRNPIYLGEDGTCEHCGYLICRECNFCKDACPGLEERGYGGAFQLSVAQGVGSPAGGTDSRHPPPAGGPNP